MFNVGGHKESVHVSLGDASCGMIQDLVEALEFPGPSSQSVPVEKVSAPFQLVAIQRTAELDALQAFCLLQLMFLQPSGLVLVCGFVEFLEWTEIGAGEVPPIRQVK